MSPSRRPTLKEQIARLEAEVDRRPKTLSVEGAAEYTGMSADRIRRLIRTDKVAAVRDGDGDPSKGRVHIIRESLDLYLDSLPSA